MAGTVLKTEAVPVRSDADVVMVRQRVRAWVNEMQFSLVDQTKIVTAASELARNTLEHGKGGKLDISMLQNGYRKGIQLVFSDDGPGIPDVRLALTDGYTTGSGMGLGLSGSKRLMNEFYIQTEVNRGTTVSCIRWK
ncbi:anti-sigma regulatory factor [Silvibacterium acidisoli]|uniref:anti-sigma regulatory factor n=1 Tax=Acidobacteriaceae bacterium ZG23-2 TaxID=2883246 RepID=UPI00406C4A45